MTTQLETTITAVTVYLDRARVTRTGQLHAEPGQYRLEITELPLTLSPDSVRVSGRGTARARLSGVNVRRAFYTETPAASVAELERRIKEIKDKQEVLADESAFSKLPSASSTGWPNRAKATPRAWPSENTT